MTRTIALAGTALALDPGLLERLASSAAGDDTVVPGLAHDEAAVAALPAGATVLALVADESAVLNAAYCRAVVALRTGDPFAAWVDTHHSDPRFTASHLLAPALARPDVSVVVRPWTGGTSPSVDELLDAAPPLGATDPFAGTLPGPVLVAAARMLRKRLVAVGALERLTAEEVADLGRRLQQAARDQGWDTTTYWGWNPRLQQRVRDELASANDRFAQTAWGTPWPFPEPAMPTTSTSLTTCPPAVVAGVVDTVDEIVGGAPAGPAPRSGPTVRQRVRSRLRRGLSR